MKHKNAFTLIELLAVIVILAIILAIAIPSVTNIISSSKLNGFNASSDMLERAAKIYMSANNITVASGTTSYILYTDMKNAGYIGKVSDPTSNNECTHSGVYVTNNSGTYTYKGALACDNYMDIDTYNIITNSDFSNGTTGWTGVAAVVSASNNILTITGNGSQTYAGALQNIGTRPASDKYYCRLRLKVTSAGATSISSFYNNYIIDRTVTTINNPVQNQWYLVSTIDTPVINITNLQFYHYYIDAATTNGKVMQVDGTVGVYVFDLTAIYGTGNEPTVTQMDNIMTNMGK